MTKAQPNTVFETKVCSRCGGTGNYSYNQIDGTRCFGCSGTGWQLTARGKAARDWWKANFFNVKASDVVVGMFIRTVTGSMKFRVATIASSNAVRSIINGVESETSMIEFRSAEQPNGRGTFGIVVGLDTMVQEVPTAEALAASLEAAKAYQETLTKAGKVRAR